jgi:hypothetical protein
VEDCANTQSSVAKPIFDGLSGKKWEFDSITLLTSRYSHHEIGIRKVLCATKGRVCEPSDVTHVKLIREWQKVIVPQKESLLRPGTEYEF